MSMSLADTWRNNPWWAKLLLAIGVVIFILEVLGVVDQIGLASLNLLALGFLFTIYGSLAELGAKLDAMNGTLVEISSKLD